MTPAQKAGLKVGDRIRVIAHYTGDMSKKGDILRLSKDDGTSVPFFFNETKNSNVCFSLISPNKWGKIGMKFKAMKFNVKDDPELSKRVQEILFGLGYRWECHGSSVMYTTAHCLTTEADDGNTSDGFIYWCNNIEEVHGEEINIDWMRKPVESPQQKELRELEEQQREIADKIKNLRENL